MLLTQCAVKCTISSKNNIDILHCSTVQVVDVRSKHGNGPNRKTNIQFVEFEQQRMLTGGMFVIEETLSMDISSLSPTIVAKI